MLYFTYGMHHSVEGKLRDERAAQRALTGASQLHPTRDVVITHYDPQEEMDRLRRVRAESMAVVVTRDGRTYSTTPTYGSTDATVWKNAILDKTLNKDNIHAVSVP